MCPIQPMDTLRWELTGSTSWKEANSLDLLAHCSPFRCTTSRAGAILGVRVNIYRRFQIPTQPTLQLMPTQQSIPTLLEGWNSCQESKFGRWKGNFVWKGEYLVSVGRIHIRKECIYCHSFCSQIFCCKMVVSRMLPYPYIITCVSWPGGVLVGNSIFMLHSSWCCKD